MMSSLNLNPREPVRNIYIFKGARYSLLIHEVLVAIYDFFFLQGCKTEGGVTKTS